jgi:putative component of membrane protein insertase Oxa1/YidC/SpoIIIJ protein YidD
MKILNIILILLLISLKGFSQIDPVKTHYALFDSEETENIYKKHTSNKSEVESVVSAMFMFYKKFISSQDHNSCVFEPSCSVYAIHSIQELGFFAGYLNAFDRLTRCHGLAAEYYKIDLKTHLLYDPVK